MKKIELTKLLPVIFGFFVMGFVDIVGISTSYVKQDFHLNDSLANMLPMMVFFWFALVSLPTSFLMKRIGRKKTVLLSMLITIVAMLLPLVGYTFPVTLAAFALLGIGNTILQVSLNPLLMNVVSGNKVTSMLTLGQFVKAICSFLGPIIVGFAAVTLNNWLLIFPIYAAVIILSFVWLFSVHIDEKIEYAKLAGSISDVLSLFKNKQIVLLFSVILLIVGFEIGLVTTIPKFLKERNNATIEAGGLACSLYYAARTMGTFLGSIILARMTSGRFFVLSMLIALCGMLGLLLGTTGLIINSCIFIVGLACANVFAIAFSLAMQQKPNQANEISALMIMGVAGGALIPPVMGFVADITTQTISLFVPFICLVYIGGVSLWVALKKSIYNY